MPTPTYSIFSDRLREVAQERMLCLVDLGARGALDTDLLPLATMTHAVGFEPEPAEAARLARMASPWRKTTILPYAVGGIDGPGTLHLPDSEVGASLLPHNESMIDEYGHVSLHRTTRRIQVNTRTLDSLIAENVLPGVDYLKVDVEGAELDVLRGARTALQRCVAVKVECAFVEQRVQQPLAHEVMAYLHQSGFDLVDIRDIHRWRRRVLPCHPCSTQFKVPYSRGRTAQADFLLFRKLHPNPDVEQANSAMLVSACLGYFDHAWTLTRHCPAIADWWRSRRVDIHHELRRASSEMGRREVWSGIWRRLRLITPLIRSALGRLPYREPEIPY